MGVTGQFEFRKTLWDKLVLRVEGGEAVLAIQAQAALAGRHTDGPRCTGAAAPDRHRPQVASRQPTFPAQGTRTGDGPIGSGSRGCGSNPIGPVNWGRPAGPLTSPTMV